MTRGNQRDLARERNEKKTAAQGHKREGPRVAGVNPDAEALQKKVAEKQRLIAEGLLEEKQKSDKPKVRALRLKTMSIFNTAGFSLGARKRISSTRTRASVTQSTRPRSA